MTISRRAFLAGAATGTAGLVISFHVPNVVRAAPKAAAPLPSPNAFLRIGTDDSVTVLLAHSEMGQGIWTGLAMLIAEELDCDWSKVRSEHAPAAAVYGHPARGIQMTGISSSTNGEFDRYRNVGATAKVLLLRAAAARWKTTPAKLTATNGVITFGDKTLTYGEVAEAAMKLPPPKTVKLKEPKEWKLIGTAVRRLDTPEKRLSRRSRTARFRSPAPPSSASGLHPVSAPARRSATAGCAGPARPAPRTGPGRQHPRRPLA